MSSKQTTCKPCGKNFGTSQALKDHLKNSPAHDFRCNICNKRISSKEGLAQHVQTAPNHVPKVGCTVCGKSFRNEGALQQHTQDSHPRAIYKCDACDKTFGSEEALEQHKRSPAHAPTFDCVDCNKSFGSEEALEMHLQNAKVHQQKAVSQGSHANRKAPEEDRTQMIFFDLHGRVAEEVSDQIGPIRFNQQPGKEHDNIYSTFVMAKFQCGGCARNSWRSGKVTIVIRHYHPNGYHAIVFNQRCEACKSLGIMTLDEDSYVQRVSYRLKAWAGIRGPHPSYGGVKKMPPHIQELCEGCIAGYCEA